MMPVRVGPSAAPEEVGRGRGREREREREREKEREGECVRERSVALSTLDFLFYV